MATLDYAKAGVNRDAADQMVEKIAALSRLTHSGKVKSAVGGYASLFALDKRRCLAASTDGVGTKLKLAFQLGQHDTVGIDLVAMSVNDLLCVGAEPLFFLDYIAIGKLEPGVVESVLKGVVAGCAQAKCALVGGETAQMPDIYREGEYDLAGFAVGVVENPRVLPRRDVRPGDILLGVGSSGMHSNGFSLLRKLLPAGGESETLARELLTPTKIYVKALAPLLKKRAFKGLAHITGSAFLNVPRISSRVSYEIHLPHLSEVPRVVAWAREASGLGFDELAKTFNLGIGMVAAVPKASASTVLKAIRNSGESAWELGQVVKPRAKQGCEVHVYPWGGSGIEDEPVSLKY